MPFKIHSHQLLLAYFALGLYAAVPALQAQTTNVTVLPGDDVGRIAQRYLSAPATAHWKTVIGLNGLRAPYVLQTGQNIKLPTKLLATTPAQATVISVAGSVSITNAQLQTRQAVVDMHLSEGDRVTTGGMASAKFRLADGSIIALMPESELLVAEHRYHLGRNHYQPIAAGTGIKGFAGLLRLVQGSLDSWATTSNERAKPLRIETPTSVVGVRGTSFRVAHDAIDAVVNTRIEVTEGLVQSELDEKRQTSVASGYGVRMDPTRQETPQTVLLLDAPDLRAWPTNHERETIELPLLAKFQGVKVVRGYRVQVSREMDKLAQNESMVRNAIVQDKKFAAHEPIRLTGLPDGHWLVSARAIDPQGIEGKNAYASLRLKARPLAPIILQPAQDIKANQSDNLKLAWAEPKQATAYQLELQKPDGTNSTQVVKEAFVVLTGLEAGQYQWRIASVEGTDQGPWSDTQRFVIVPQPAPVQIRLGDDGEGAENQRNLILRWAAQSADQYELQVARDASFRPSETLALKTIQPHTRLQNPQSGKHHIRYRSIAKDGFVGQWSDVMVIEIPPDWRQLLIYLGGASRQWP